MRLRVEYRVGPELRFLANLDMLHTIERALRRARIPYALSEGFNPHIKLSLGTVLPVGLWGEREYFDLELMADMSGEEFVKRLNPVLPSGLMALQAVNIPPSAPSLMSVVNAASYAFKVKKLDEAVLDQLQVLMHRPELLVASRGKKKNRIKDLKPGLYKITMMTHDQFDIIKIWVSTGQPVNVRFDELIELFGTCGITAEQLVDVWRCGNFCRVEEQFYTPMEQVKLL